MAKKEIIIRAPIDPSKIPSGYQIIRKQVEEETEAEKNRHDPLDLSDQAYDTWRDMQGDPDFMQAQEAVA